MKGLLNGQKIERIAQKFHDYLSSPKIQDSLNAINIPNAKSQKVEERITPFAQEIGFSSQKKGLFEKYKVSKLTPDYYMQIEKNRYYY